MMLESTDLVERRLFLCQRWPGSGVVARGWGWKRCRSPRWWSPADACEGFPPGRDGRSSVVLCEGSTVPRRHRNQCRRRRRRRRPRRSNRAVANLLAWRRANATRVYGNPCSANDARDALRCLSNHFFYVSSVGTQFT